MRECPCCKTPFVMTSDILEEILMHYFSDNVDGLSLIASKWIGLLEPYRVQYYSYVPVITPYRFKVIASKLERQNSPLLDIFQSHEQGRRMWTIFPMDDNSA